MKHINIEDVYRVRDNALFKQWQTKDHEIFSAKKRLPKNHPANSPEAKRILDIFLEHGIIEAVKTIRKEKNLGLADAVQWMKDRQMWVDNFGNWEYRD